MKVRSRLLVRKHLLGQKLFQQINKDNLLYLVTNLRYVW